jgi:hypothetical protein
VANCTKNSNLRIKLTNLQGAHITINELDISAGIAGFLVRSFK